MFRSLLIASFALAVSGLAVADVYKFKDEHGNTLYTDKPGTLPAERLNVKSQKTDVVAVQERQQQDLQRMQEQNSARDKSAASQKDQKEAAQLTAKDKADRCAKARERYDQYMNSQRLYEQQPNGERRYLSDQELDAARASAKATMDVMCK